MKLYIRNKRKMPHSGVYRTQALVIVRDLGCKINCYGELINELEVCSIYNNSYNSLSFRVPKKYVNKYYTFKEDVTYNSLEKKFNKTIY